MQEPKWDSMVRVGLALNRAWSLFCDSDRRASEARLDQVRGLLKAQDKDIEYQPQEAGECPAGGTYVRWKIEQDGSLLFWVAGSAIEWQLHRKGEMTFVIRNYIDVSDGTLAIIADERMFADNFTTLDREGFFDTIRLYWPAYFATNEKQLKQEIGRAHV